MRHWKNRHGRRIWLVALAALTIAASTPSGAGAKPVIVGSLLEGKLSRGEVSTEGTYFNSSLSEPGAHVVSPVDGAIIEVNLLGINEGPYRIRVLSPDGGSSYTGMASSPSLLIGPSGETEFHTLRIEAGDTVGLDMPAGAKLSALLEAGPKAAYAFWAPPLEDGASLPYTGTETGVEMAFNAVVPPEPKVLRIGPSLLATGKHNQVKIHGNDFQRVIKVSFGGVRATNWRIVNEHLIVAKTGSTKKEKQTHVRVQTAAGTSAPTPASAVRFQDPGRG